MSTETYYEEIDSYEPNQRWSRRDRRYGQKTRRIARDALPELMAEQSEGDDDFQPSYASSHNEQRMLQAALTGFYQENILTDVLAPVKGGKEATVYCCQAHPSTGLELIAAKIYRPAAFRTMRNDVLYREGREILDADGKAIRDTRRHRALAKKTRYGREVATGSWIEHEYATLRSLHGIGADVPRPVARAGNVILMEYLGDMRRPAPDLNGVRLAQGQARPMFERLLQNVEMMLGQNRVHADLSAYNILYWQDRATIIDFPQAVVATTNHSAFALLQRDLERLCQYFSRYGVAADAAALARGLWQRFLDAEL